MIRMKMKFCDKIFFVLFTQYTHAHKHGMSYENSLR